MMHFLIFDISMILVVQLLISACTKRTINTVWSVNLQRFCKTPNFSNTLSSKCEETFAKRESTSWQLSNAALDSMIGSLDVENEFNKDSSMLFCSRQSLCQQLQLTNVVMAAKATNRGRQYSL